MYKELEEKGTLPKADAQPMRCNYGCVVGVTHALDPVVYPVLKEEFCEFEAVLGTDSPFTIRHPRCMTAEWGKDWSTLACAD